MVTKPNGPKVLINKSTVFPPDSSLFQKYFFQFLSLFGLPCLTFLRKSLELCKLYKLETEIGKGYCKTKTSLF